MSDFKNSNFWEENWTIFLHKNLPNESSFYALQKKCQFRLAKDFSNNVLAKKLSFSTKSEKTSFLFSSVVIECKVGQLRQVGRGRRERDSVPVYSPV